MLSLSHQATLNVLRAIAAPYTTTQHTDMLPSAGTPERIALVHAVKHCFAAPTLLLSNACITLDEWASVLADHEEIDHLNLFDASPSAFSNHLQRSYRHASASLAQEARSLATLLQGETNGTRTLVSWLSLQTVSGFMLGALLPHTAGWQARSLFESANALWELNPGDIIVTSDERWRQLAQRLPALPEGVTAVSTAPLDASLHQTLRDKGVARIVELYSQPELGTLAARETTSAAFELLAHWHPTESDDYLLRLSAGYPMQEVSLAEPIEWVGSRHFHPGTSQAVALPEHARSSLMIQGLKTHPAWPSTSAHRTQDASAA